MPNVRINKNDKTMRINYLCFGDWFYYDDKIYIRLRHDGDGVGVIDVINGGFLRLPENLEVKLIQSKNITIIANL